MILDASSGIRGKVIDLDTGLVVRKVIRLNTDTGHLKAYKVLHDGTVARDAAGSPVFYEAVGKFKFVPAQPKRISIAAMGAAKCARCPSTMTLPGDDLCPKCRASDRGQRNKMVVEPLSSFEINHKCARCSRGATIAVSDETEVTPQLSGFTVKKTTAKSMLVPVAGGNQQWARAATVGRRYYCARCFQPPQLVDAKGEVIQQLESSVRPK